MKKVLIVSYYWPPAGGISVLRSLKIAKYLTQFGWTPVVLTVSNPQYPILEPNNSKHIPEGLEVIKAKSVEPFGFYKRITGRKKADTLSNVLNANDKKHGVFHKLAVWIRANYFIPDARMLWMKPAIKAASKYLSENKVDAIFSDGPPHTNTLIACRLSKKFDIPWLMDWQDPWTQVDYYKMFPIGKRADKKHKKLEAECLKQASKMTIVSPTWKEDAEAIGASNVSVVVWGYDEDDFETIEPVKTSKFLITHTGLLGEDRLPDGFIKALKELVDEYSDFKEALEVKLFGTVDKSVNELVNSLDLRDNFEIGRQIPRNDALSYNMGSAIQLLLLNKQDNAKGRTPGKLFEYLRAKRTIICCGPIDSDVSKLLQKTGAGETFEYNDVEGMKKSILKEYKRFKAGNEVIEINGLEQYHIKNLTGQIAEYLNEITN